ncbi:MAG TPA: DUF6311 domain-containing protein [Chitinivibrionales bacterium]|nr:DUF6311 domain-containing protein [Chitinivibrionales bacterium]
MSKSSACIFSPVSAALLGAAFFIAVYGCKILNPLFIEWTLRQDAATHFLGWHFFRTEPWHFPLGIVQSLNYPQGTSVVFTDSIPLIAFLLKPFSPFLPAHFQYHGIWLLLSYMLQGIFGWYLVSRFIKNRYIAFVGTLFFIMSPVLVQRAELHESLTAHWILLAALYLYFDPDTLHTRIKWGVLFFAASMIHFYFLFMIVLLYSGYFLRNSLESDGRHRASIFSFSVISAFMLCGAMWIEGYFIIGIKEASASGFGYYSMNLLAPLNPMPFTSFLFFNALPSATLGQYEGFNYLGLGLILLGVTSGIAGLRHKYIVKKSNAVPLALTCLILFLLSISNAITFANHELLHLRLPQLVYEKLGIIRASGRMFWPITYILTLSCLVLIVRIQNSRKAAIIISFAVVIQIMDFFPFYRSVSIDRTLWKNSLHSNVWAQCAKRYDHIACIPALVESDNYVPFALYAGDHGLTINVASMARADYFAKSNYRNDQKNLYARGSFDKNTLYVFLNKSTVPDFLPSDSLRNHAVRWVDGYPIIMP